MANSIETLTIDKTNDDRQQLIENLQRVIEEKNVSITKLEEREQILQETLKRRNAEFHQLEDKLKKFEEKTLTFEQLHRLQVQTFEKTIHDNQIENERLCEQINGLADQLREKSSYDAIDQEKLLTFDRIVADARLWREKLDSYKTTIEQKEETIANLRKEIHEFQKKKQTNVEVEDESTRTQINAMQNLLQDREKQIENLKLTLRRVRDTLQPVKNPPSPTLCRTANENFDDIQLLNERVLSLEELLIQRDDQITTLRKVHDKRWSRLKHLQKQNRAFKDELQLYIDTTETNFVDFSYRKAVRKAKTGCSICDDHRWRKSVGINAKVFKQEDDDAIWNEATKLRKENARLHEENLNFQEKLDLQQVEINEQIVVIGELRNEIRALREKPKVSPKFSGEKVRLMSEIDKKFVDLENERSDLIVENERLKTSVELCQEEKENVLKQRNQIRSDLKKTKLRILALQDQISKLKRNQTKNDVKSAPIVVVKRRMSKKKVKKPIRLKSCLELLLDQNSTLVDEQQNESSISIENSIRKRTRKPSICSSTISRKRCGNFRSTPSIRISALRERIEQLQNDLTESRTENEHLQQRLSSTLTRISMLKSSNEKLSNEFDQLKTTQSNSPMIDQNAQQIDHLYERLKNTSLDAAQQRKLNKNLQNEIENLNKNLQSLNEKLIHAERDINSKRTLIENYKTQLEIQNQRVVEKISTENDERTKTLTDLNEKLRIQIESFKNRLAAITRDKHELDQRFNQLVEENSKLTKKFSTFDEIQLKIKTNEQQIRQMRNENDQLTNELISTRRSSDEQLTTLKTKFRLDFDRLETRWNELEKFVKELLLEMIRRNTDLRETLKRTVEHQKQRDSLSMTLPGYDAAMNTASKILNLTQDDLDEIMSMTDESFQMKPKIETVTKDDKIKDKVDKLFASNEQFTGKLMKIFLKKLDEIQTADRELAAMKNF